MDFALFLLIIVFIFIVLFLAVYNFKKNFNKGSNSQYLLATQRIPRSRRSNTTANNSRDRRENGLNNSSNSSLNNSSNGTSQTSDNHKNIVEHIKAEINKFNNITINNNNSSRDVKNETKRLSIAIFEKILHNFQRDQNNNNKILHRLIAEEIKGIRDRINPFTSDDHLREICNEIKENLKKFKKDNPINTNS